MNKSEIVACIYKHVGRTDDLKTLTGLAEEISQASADDERKECIRVLENIRDTRLITDGSKALADDFINAIRERHNVEVQGREHSERPTGAEG